LFDLEGTKGSAVPTPNRIADILVLDEPTAAMDAEAEFQIFNHLRTVPKTQMVILIYHR